MEIPFQKLKRILSIAQEVRSHVPRQGGYCLPEGLCGEASLAVSVRLTRAGIPHEIWGGRWTGPITSHVGIAPEHEAGIRWHAWIQFPQYDNVILDVTADQYHAVPPVWFPAKKEWYERLEEFHPEDIFEAAEKSPEKLGKPTIPLSGPLFRRPPSLKVRVRNHLRYPPAACLCHRSKMVDRVRRKLVKRLS